MKNLNTKARKPNLFILGAPKCGTTSLASWLGEHPNIFMSQQKEPQYFSPDYAAPLRPQSIRAYENLFAEAGAHHTIVGEASTVYLRSRVAVPNILNYAPNSRFIVCLRNPLEMVLSCHAQQLKMGMETEAEFARAWNMQWDRKDGKNIPITCPDKKLLLYGEICQLGRQLNRLFQIVPQDQVLVIFLEDIKNNVRHEYQRVLSFLDVADDGRIHFPVENERAIPRFPFLSQAVKRVWDIKVRLGFKKNLGWGKLFHRLNNFNPGSTRVPLEMKASLYAYFKQDIALLATITQRDLSHWLE